MHPAPAPGTQHLAPALSTQHSAPSTLPTYIYDADTPRLLATPKHYAYVKIAEGCDYKCAFCIIPTLRGKYRSRPSDSIVTEARALAARGVKELLLISQDTTFYGIDRHERGALARLLRELNTIDGLEWIRLLYLYPTTIDDATLAAMADCDKVCKYIDLPLQHASNAVLKRMKRPGTRQSYDTLLGHIRSQVPGVALRTTFIVGFPGETDQDVDELCSFVEDHGFDHVGVFTYSHEEGTSAFGLDDDVPAKLKKARRSRVMGLQKRLVTGRQRARVGERARIVVCPLGEQRGLPVARGRDQECERDVVCLHEPANQPRPGHQASRACGRGHTSLGSACITARDGRLRPATAVAMRAVMSTPADTGRTPEGRRQHGARAHP
jgi:ribosomal protein S12 methylthiotransferase